MTVSGLKRNKIACTVSPLIGCILVGIVGTVLLFLVGFLDGLFDVSGSHGDLFEYARSTENPWVMGMMGTFSGMIIALFLFFLFYPFALAIWAPVMGRLPHNRVSHLRRYLVRGSVVGALICSMAAALMIHVWIDAMSWDDFTGANRFDFPPLPLTISATVTGAFGGAIVGTLTAWVHYLILRPDLQLGPAYTPTVEVFD